MQNPFDGLDKRRHERLARWLRELRSWRNVRVAPVRDWQFDAGDGQARTVRLGEAWPVVATPVRLVATATMPADWAGLPVEVELWLGGEGFVRFTPGFQTGLNPFHHDFRLTDAAAGGETVRIEAEVVPKGMFGSHIAIPAIGRAHLVVPCDPVRALEYDLKMLVETASQLEEPRHEAFPRLVELAESAYRALAPAWPSATDTAMTRYVTGDVDGGNAPSIGLGDYGLPAYEGALVMPSIWHVPPPADALEPLPEAALPAIERARNLIAEGLEEIKRSYPPVGQLVLSGHAHIDLAWLWPLAETRRKVRRTFSSVLRLMEQYEDFTFNQSSAQVYAWLEEDDPALLERVTARIAEGRWELVGGSWTEPDGQVTGGEAFVRQLFYGQRYFQERFGLRSTVAWLPDVFGFSGAIPQLLRGAGIDAFFTTKLNWNETNTFPYDLYLWEGIDGSRVVAHSFLNPGHGYNGNIAPLDTFGTWQNFRGKRGHDQTILAFGWGDGGGGPSEEMLEQYARIKEYPTLPRLRMGKMEAFFAALPREGLPVYVGELYLELHRATLTTQALTKQLNRQAEHRLAEAEVFSTLAGGDYPHQALDAAWKTLLLHQFHDILPGSSIYEVYEDTHPALRGVVATAVGVRDEALRSIAGAGAAGVAVGNAGLSDRPLTVLLPSDAGSVALGDGAALPAQAVEGGTLVHAPEQKVSGLSVTPLRPAAGPPDDVAEPVSVARAGDGATLENDRLRVEVGADGTLHRVFDKRAGREALAGRGNQLWAYVDRPRSWDAWDIDETYEGAGEEIMGIDAVEFVEEGPLRAAVRIRRRWRSTTITQTYRLLAASSRLDVVTEIDWHERLMLLRALFPTNVHTHEATFETMYGVVRRPTHRNTTWEQARFEVGAHRFVDLSEPSYGVALLNDAKYGHSVHGQTLGISLVRGPLYPDPLADEGTHHFTYSLLPHASDWVAAGVTFEAHALNSPLIAVPVGTGEADRSPFVRATGVALGLGALKRAHDRDGVVLRLYEPHGDRGTATLTFGRPPHSVGRVNLLEEDVEGGALTVTGSTVDLDVRPFEVVSLLIEG